MAHRQCHPPLEGATRRVAALVDTAGLRISVMGELHPEVLQNYGLKHPVAAMELSLEKLLAAGEPEA